MHKTTQPTARKTAVGFHIPQIKSSVKARDLV